jgi:archaellum component FlaC
MTNNDLDKRLDEQFNRFGKKLFEYLDQRFAEVDEHIDRVESRVRSVEGAIDAVAKQQEIDEHERLAINHQLDRHDRWHHQADDKLGIKLDYQEP